MLKNNKIVRNSLRHSFDAENADVQILRNLLDHEHDMQRHREPVEEAQVNHTLLDAPVQQPTQKCPKIKRRSSVEQHHQQRDVDRRKQQHLALGADRQHEAQHFAREGQPVGELRLKLATPGRGEEQHPRALKEHRAPELFKC